MRKKLAVITAAGAAILMLVMILLPSILVHHIKESASSEPVSGASSPTPGKPDASSVIVPVYLTKERKIDRVPLEDYVKGVVAAEMPIDFELEALKAQAIAARTYIVRRMAGAEAGDQPVKGAWVNDTVQYQAYVPLETLRKRWGKAAYEQNMAKLNKAVKETEDWILTYQGKPIDAAFFSTSNGYTENSEDYWSSYIPYLRSVPSPWDKGISPKYKQTVTMTLTTFLRKLGIGSAGRKGTGIGSAKVISLTDGHRIKQLQIAGRKFTGREVREKLGLASSEFTWRIRGSKIQITTRGSGHGVGMSQWGANGMAREGKTAEQIVTYYYQGVTVSKSPNIAGKIYETPKV